MAGLVPFNKSGIRSMDPFRNMLDDFFNDDWSPRRSLLSDTFKVDVQENEKEYIVSAELPGIAKDEICLELDDGKLSISVVREERTDNERDGYIHKERRHSSMSRSLYLSGASDDGVSAELEDGVLKLEIPKEKRNNDKKRIKIN